MVHNLEPFIPQTFLSLYSVSGYLDVESFHLKCYFPNKEHLNYFSTTDDLLTQHYKAATSDVSSFSSVLIETTEQVIVLKNRTFFEHRSGNLAFQGLHFVTTLLYLILIDPSILNNTAEGYIPTFLIPARDENPSLIVFHVTDTLSMDMLSNYVRKHFKLFPYSSRYLIWFRGGIQEIYLSNNLGILPDDKSWTLSSMLGGTKLNVRMAPITDSCEEVPKTPILSWLPCVVLALSTKLNVTIIPATRHSLLQRLGDTGGYHVPLDLYINIILYHEMRSSKKPSYKTLDRTVISSAAFLSVPYTFVTIYNREDNGMTAFTKPFQAEIWIVVIILMFIFPLFMTLSMKIGAHKNLRFTLADMIFVSFAGAISQCDDHSTRFITGSKLARSLWILWSFASITLLNAYDGQFFSFLAAESPIDSSENLKQVVDNRLPMITFKAVWMETNETYQQNSTRIGGGADRQIRVSGFIESFLKRAIEAHQGRSTYYSDLNDLLHWSDTQTPEEHARMLVDISLGRHPFSKIPFVMIDTADKIFLLRNLISYIKTKRFSQIILADNFAMMYSCYIRRSVIMPMIDKVFQDLRESGHFLKWHVSSIRRAGKDALVILKGWGDNLTKSSKHYRLKKLFHTSQYGSIEGDRIRHATAYPVAIPWSLVRNVVELALILFGASLVAYIAEVVVHWEVSAWKTRCAK